MSTFRPIERLSQILDILRKECPWDSAQTIDSLRYLTIEEVYELSDAVLQLSDETSDKPVSERASELSKELGDIQMHILFYAKIAHDRGLFSFDDVCTAVSDKLVSRHPHIALPLADGTLRPPLTDRHPGWEQVKMKEGRRSVLSGVPKGLPALVKAIRLQEKAAGIGCPVQPRCQTLADNLSEEQAGDLLFDLVAQLHQQGINADEALSRANDRFAEKVRHWEEKNNADAE